VSESDGVRDLSHEEALELAGAFVLGALEPAEDAAMRAHLATCGESHEEIDELGGVLPVLAESVPIVEPPAGLRARIMAAAAADLAARSAGAPAAQAPQATGAAPSSPVATTPAVAPATVAFPGPEEREARTARRASTGTRLLRIAAVFAIVALGGLSLLLGVQLNAARSYEDGVASVLEVAAQPGSLTAILTADGGTGSGLAAVSASGEVTIAMQALAPTSGSQVYTAWVIAGTAAPVPVGSFTVGNAGTAVFEGSGVPTAGPLVLALTREPGPGATTPTMPIISKGVATGAA
jgi:anti-sigma-K factor RskA